MARHYGIPYMGSKQKLVDKIVPFILKRHPDANAFYDLFGGGGSVALYTALKYPNLAVIYNERSTAIAGLLQRLKDGDPIPTDFVTRSEFLNKFKGDDWYAGLLQSVWTFGNNQHSYLYGKDLQEFKRALHGVVVDGDNNLEYLESFVQDYIRRTDKRSVSINLFLDNNRYKTPYQRRIVLSRQLDRIGALQHLARIERLVQIQNMPGLNTLAIYSGLSYDEVPVLDKHPILYCDPPYEGTAEYREGGFDHKKFYEWVMSREYPVYVSSYKVSDSRLKLVRAVNTRSLMNSAYDGKATYNYENLYWNGVQ